MDASARLKMAKDMKLQRPDVKVSKMFTWFSFLCVKFLLSVIGGHFSDLYLCVQCTYNLHGCVIQTSLYNRAYNTPWTPITPPRWSEMQSATFFLLCECRCVSICVSKYCPFHYSWAAKDQSVSLCHTTRRLMSWHQLRSSGSWVCRMDLSVFSGLLVIRNLYLTSPWLSSPQSSLIRIWTPILGM